MTALDVKKDISISSRLSDKTLTEEQIKVIDFIINYSFKDNKEIYTNGTILVPLYRVIDAITQKGENYISG